MKGCALSDSQGTILERSKMVIHRLSLEADSDLVQHLRQLLTQAEQGLLQGVLFLAAQGETHTMGILGTYNEDMNMAYRHGCVCMKELAIRSHLQAEMRRRPRSEKLRLVVGGPPQEEPPL